LNNVFCSIRRQKVAVAWKWLLQACAVMLVLCVALFSQPGFAGEIENTSDEGSETVVTQQESQLFKDADWHKNKWQNMPAIIEISEKHLNLLFNRPEIVFELRRAIRFEWDDTHDYNDGKIVTRYRFSRLGERQAVIEYQSALVEDPSQTASGSFTIEARP